MSVRAKFQCTSANEVGEGFKNVSMSPVFGGSEENKRFFNATPSGSIQLGVINAEAAQQFEVGKEYYVDFTPA